MVPLLSTHKPRRVKIAFRISFYPEYGFAAGKMTAFYAPFAYLLWFGSLGRSTKATANGIVRM
jgi:energy-converting hydrogenase Eha subunit F